MSDYWTSEGHKEAVRKTQRRIGQAVCKAKVQSLAGTQDVSDETFKQVSEEIGRRGFTIIRTQEYERLQYQIEALKKEYKRLYDAAEFDRMQHPKPNHVANTED